MLKGESWTYAWDYDENESHIILNSNNEPIGEVYETQEGVEVASYRAELIADAPYLLSLLRQLYDRVDHMTESYDTPLLLEVRHAIDKHYAFEE